MPMRRKTASGEAYCLQYLLFTKSAAKNHTDNNSKDNYTENEYIHKHREYAFGKTLGKNTFWLIIAKQGCQKWLDGMFALLLKH